jgi:hypothetical protein
MLPRLLDLLVLQPDRLSVDEYTLAFVRLWLPPHSDLRSELHDSLLLNSFQQDTSRLGSACLDSLGNGQLNRVRVADLQIDELLSRKLRLDGGSGGLDRSTVTDTHKAQNGGMALGDT